MKELSIFVDEFGDFGETDDKQSYYIVSFVFHDQGNDISEEVKHLEKSITQSGFRIEYIQDRLFDVKVFLKITPLMRGGS